jgi:hypothetical protein
LLYHPIKSTESEKLVLEAKVLPAKEKKKRKKKGTKEI